MVSAFVLLLMLVVAAPNTAMSLALLLLFSLPHLLSTMLSVGLSSRSNGSVAAGGCSGGMSGIVS